MELVKLTNEAALAREVRAVLQLGGVRQVCQPVVSLSSGVVVGYEALSRPAARPPLDAPDEFLRHARDLGLLAETDRVWRQAAIERFARMLPPDALLFLNVSPGPLLSGEFRPAGLLEQVRRHGIQPERIVLELTEEHAINDFHGMRQALGAFRSDGFLIAIDDAGAGQSSLQSVVEVRPHFVKLDRWLTTAVASDAARQSMVEAMTSVAHRIGARVVAEGIETLDELRTLIELGVDSGQGYLLGSPAALPEAPAEEISSFIRRTAGTTRTHRMMTGSTSVGEIAVAVPTVAADAPGGGLLEIFRANDLLDAVVVMDGAAVRSVATRSRVLLRFAVNHGYSVYAGRPARLLGAPATTVAAGESVRTAAAIALERAPGTQNDPLVVLNEGRLAGLVSVADLMRQLLAIDLAEARLSSPLTGLPGNVLIRQRVESMAASREPLLFLYADIDSFKTFNDRFGFGAGDAAIVRLAEILKSACGASQHESFVGHIGGDDFALVVHQDDLARVRAAITGELMGRWFDPDEAFAASTLTVTVAGSPLLANLTYEEAAARLAHAKSMLKARGGDCFVVFSDLADIGSRAA